MDLVMDELTNALTYDSVCKGSGQFFVPKLDMYTILLSCQYKLQRDMLKPAR